MKLPIAWLRDYLDVEIDADAIAERLAGLGFPVDAIERRPRLSGVVIGRLIRVEKHPDADRLQVCTVDVGRTEPLTIATAAANVATGQVVPVATIGAQLVGLQIAPRKMRGIASEGMLCSAEELGLEAAWFEDGIMQLEPELPIGADFVEFFRLSDDVLDVEVTANRVDALSILGLARELGAALGITVREPSLALERSDPSPNPTPGDCVVLDSADCKRYVAQRISGIRVGPAPFWMRVRLALAGQRPIDNVVDISNFVMLEGAQPLHFYDYERLAGGTLVVRDARPGERIKTLDEAERTLDARFLVIADGAEPQCIAGLKGSASSEVSNATRELLVEAATFSGPRIRRMSVALGVRTEASSRHEKGLPLGLSTWGAARAAHLLQRSGATIHAPATFGASDAPDAPIVLEVARIGALLGIDVDVAGAQTALQALGFTVALAGTQLAVTPPPWRSDVRIAEDVVEEVARVIGYDRIGASMPAIFPQDVSSAAYRDENRIAHALAALGYRELLTMSLQSASVAQTYARAGITLPGDVVEIANPLSEDQRYLRFSLLPALLEHVKRYAGDEALRTFEIGHVFEGTEPFETAGVAWLLSLPNAADEPAWRDGGFADFKSDSLAFARALAGRDADAVAANAPGWHPGKTAALLVDGKDVALTGAVDPRLLAAYGIEARVYAGWMRLADLPQYRVPRYVAPSKFPPVARDLAVIVAPHIPAMDVEHAVRAGGDGVIADVRVFDEYRGPQIGNDAKSLAVHVVLQRRDATLTDREADGYIETILASLRERCGARLRE